MRRGASLVDALIEALFQYPAAYDVKPPDRVDMIAPFGSPEALLRELFFALKEL